jgi:hypothetical protein
MNARTIRRAAERQARKAEIKAQKSQTYAATPELTGTEPKPEPKTTSPAQFAANRANAQLSHGPATPEGKAASSRNHTIHGLTAQVSGAPFTVLPGEDQSLYDAALTDYKAEWKPTTATELDLVQRLCTHAWLRDRALRLQDAHLALGLTTPQEYKQFEVLGRYYTTHLRAYNKAFADLMRLKRFQMSQKKDEALLERRAQDTQIRFESQKRKAEEHELKMQRLRDRENRKNSTEPRAQASSRPNQPA